MDRVGRGLVQSAKAVTGCALLPSRRIDVVCPPSESHKAR